MSDEDYTSEELDAASAYLWDARQNDPPLAGHLLRAVARLQRRIRKIRVEALREVREIMIASPNGSREALLPWLDALIAKEEQP